MTEREVTIRVKEATYEEWRTVAEREYDGMDDLIRTAVRREIDGDHDPTLSDILESLRNPYE